MPIYNCKFYPYNILNIFFSLNKTKCLTGFFSHKHECGFSQAKNIYISLGTISINIGLAAITVPCSPSLSTLVHPDTCLTIKNKN